MGAQFIKHMGAGFLTGAVLFAITGIIAVLVWPRERSSKNDEVAAKTLSISDILRSFILPTRNCRDFYLALVGRLLLMVAGLWSPLTSRTFCKSMLACP